MSGSSVLENCKCFATYLNLPKSQVEIRLKEEKERCDLYLHESTQDLLAKTLEKVLITKQLDLFQNEFGNLLESNKVVLELGNSVIVYVQAE